MNQIGLDTNSLLTPLEGGAPAGADCGATTELQQLAMLGDYLGAKAEQDELELTAGSDFHGDNAESDRRAALAFAEDGARRLADLEKFAKDLLGKSPTVAAVRNDLVRRAAALLQTVGKDLAVVQVLQLAWVSEHGLHGLQAAFRLCDSLFETYGAALHPMADEDAPEDYSARAMIVSEMLSGANLLAIFQQLGVLSNQTARSLSIRNVEAVAGAPPDSEVSMRLIEQAKALTAQLVAVAVSGDDFPADQDAAQAILDERLQLVDSCINLATSLVGRFKAGTVRGGDKVVASLVRVKKLMQHLVDQAKSLRQPVAGGDADHTAPRKMGGEDQVQSGGGLQTRDDARRMILEICKFLEAKEPGHPAPYFLRRAERLLGAKDFFVIMRDMVPDAVAEVERITGHRDASE
jgi:type VI secretion system protein ImpA